MSIRLPRPRKLSLPKLSKYPLLVGCIAIFALTILLAGKPASATSNPIFATVQFVHDAIANALAPVQTAISALQSQQSAQSAQLNALSNSSRSMKLIDSNDQVLGNLVNNNGYSDTVFVPSLSKFVEIADNPYQESQGGSTDPNGIGNRINPLYYRTDDCTGTAFSSDLNYHANHVMSFSTSQYYVFHVGDASQYFDSLSRKYWNPSENTYQCTVGSSSNFTGWPLYQVSLPFSLPVAQPVQFKFQ